MIRAFDIGLEMKILMGKGNLDRTKEIDNGCPNWFATGQFMSALKSLAGDLNPGVLS